MLYIKEPISSGRRVGEENFDIWHQITNIYRPVVKCRLCNQTIGSVPATSDSNIPCASEHKSTRSKRLCPGSGLPGVVIRKL